MPFERSTDTQNSQLLEKNNNANASQATTGNDSRFDVNIPSISIPKGGGAIKGIDENFEVNAVNGTACISLPLPSASARGFGASLSISYNSGSGNGLFGMGWSLSLSSIRRKTTNELPQYIDAIDSDTYIFNGGEDLVPAMQETAGNWMPVELDSADNQFRIKRYRPRTEGSFMRIERWTKKTDGRIHWRITGRDNITSLFGDTASSTITDPADPTKIFEWLLRFSYDDKGNCTVYEYEPEDGAGIDADLLHNRNRTNGNVTFTNTYIKRILSGNIEPYRDDDPIPPATQFAFEVVFDYGEHDLVNEPFAVIRPWTFRTDAFSDYRSGFEIRTCRLCSSVLLYHQFAELPGGSALVSSQHFTYDNNGQIGNFTFLKEVASFGYIKHSDDTYTKKNMPPLSFEYQQHEWNKELKTVPAESSVNAPIGIYQPAYQWIDLYNEGLNGILTDQASGLYYKENLGDGNFSAARQVSPKPSFSGAANWQFQDLESNGINYLVGYHDDVKGFFKIEDDNGWHPFQAFAQMPNIDYKDKNTRFIDLNGDGKAEILITEDNVFSWYPCLGETGFEQARKVWQHFDEEKGPHIVFNDVEQSVYLSDMNGDGLTDIVRIKNGSVCYWPNLGYGRFGAKVSMDYAPVFDHPEAFNASWIKLADIDGSGTSDIIYLGKQQFSIWLNQHGNGFLPAPELIDPFPEISNMSQVAIIDFLGSGTSCIVWSSMQPKDANWPLQYIDLMNGRKPHLMRGYRNNMGKEVELEYISSTWFYLQDKLNGTPWVTKLPFPVHCLKKTVYYDRIMKTRFASEYSYHHGYYDHVEREFRGFGRVEQKDAEDIAHFIKESAGALNNTLQQDLHQPPVLTKTWFHTGAFLDREKILNQFAHEYSPNSFHPENLLSEPSLPEGLSIDEWRQALRACKSMLLRKETYALDEGPLSDNPYTVEQQNCAVILVQPQKNNKHASFAVVSSENISYQYERSPEDPRVSHNFTLEVDAFANVKKSLSLVYKRKLPAFPEQNIIYASCTENNYTNFINDASAWRTPALFETKLYEITGLPAAAGDYYTLPEMKNAVVTALAVDYDATPDGTLQKRLMNWSRLQFRDDAGMVSLPFGTLPSKALLHQTFKAAFNRNQLTKIFAPKINAPALDAALLDPAGGGYIFADDHYWVPSVIAEYDSVHFFQATSFTDPFGNVSQVVYDNKYHFFIERSIDALNNELLVKQFNYRTMKPGMMQDINDNLTAVRFDELGAVNKTFVIGKKGIDAGDEFDDTQIEASVNDVPSVEMEYHVFEWHNQTTGAGFDINNYKPSPNYIRTRIRDTHYHTDPFHQTKIQESYTWFTGTGQEALKKVQAEPGEALQVNPDGTVSTINTSPNLRWVGNGRVILNNKGKAVKQYEPYFSVAPTFDDEKEMVELGVTAIIHYDAPGRIIRTDFPDETFSSVEFTAWQQKNFDQNDNVATSKWYAQRILDPDAAIATPEEISAAQKAFAHNNTPAIAHLDTLGRNFFTETDNVTEQLTTHIKMDMEGKQLEMTDAAGRKVIQYEYDLLGRTLKQSGMDTGTRWSLQDVGNTALLSWDDRDHAFSFVYDQLRRAISSSVKTGNEQPIVFGRIEYGESLAPAIAKANNLIGVACRTYDQSGISTINKNDFKGNQLSASKQLVTDYKNTINWTTPGSVVLEPEIFTSSTEYDALNRPVKTVTPHSPAMQPSEMIPAYNEAGMLERMDVRIRGAATITAFVTNIDYDAKGQRQEILYANGTKTTYTYNRHTFRLINLKTTRNSGPPVLQNLKYTYDPIGNITHIKDDAQPDIFF